MKRQKGTLRVEERKHGAVWVLRYMATRERDLKRVERSLVVGDVKEFPTCSSMRNHLEAQGVIASINNSVGGRFGALVEDFVAVELISRINPRSADTLATYHRIINRRIIPHWGTHLSGHIRPLDVETWLATILTSGASRAVASKTRSLMNMIFDHGIRRRLVPQEVGNPIRFVRLPKGGPM